MKNNKMLITLGFLVTVGSMNATHVKPSKVHPDEATLSSPVKDISFRDLSTIANMNYESAKTLMKSKNAHNKNHHKLVRHYLNNASNALNSMMFRIVNKQAAVVDHKS